MEELSLQFLPFPHLFQGVRRDGTTQAWPKRCCSCDRQCETAPGKEVQVCSYGVNFVRVDDDLLIAGVVVHDFPTTSSAHQKMKKRMGKSVVALKDLEAIVKAGKKATAALAEELESRKQYIIDEYRRSKRYQSEAVQLLRPDIQRALAQVHDYRQLVTQIVQNINVILETEFPGERVAASLRRSSHEIQAIYWSARLMESKLEAALFLMYPERINDPGKRRAFRLHGLVTKYVEIYRRSLERRGVSITVSGLSYGSIFANPDAVGVIPHSFLDNAAKYSPPQSPLIIDFKERGDNISLSVSSYGPRIEQEEQSRIFDLFFRGKAATQQVAEGTGFGLALAQQIATAIGAELSVTQDPEPGHDSYYLTTFVAQFRRASKDEAWGTMIAL